MNKLVVALSILSIVSCVVAQSDDDIRAALIDLYNSTQGPAHWIRQVCPFLFSFFSFNLMFYGFIYELMVEILGNRCSYLYLGQHFVQGINFPAEPQC